MNRDITKLEEISIENFRALKDVKIDMANKITVLCGKNGTQKSTILGIAAQIFSFSKNYHEDINIKSYKTLTGFPYKSQYREHFRISKEYDKPGSMTVSFKLHDGYSGKMGTGELALSIRSDSGEDLPRPVVRKNSLAIESGANGSRNFTHPVIFLSLKRLYPIAARDYQVVDIPYLEKHKDEFKGISNEILNKTSSNVIGTTGTIKSAVTHGDNYDQESVSAGEDNVGQIALAIMSFEKLKAEYKDYKGGLLLIDEADAGLFPAAQINMFKVLARKCRELNLQVIMTSHSPTLIEYAYNLGGRGGNEYKTIYLSDTYSKNVQVYEDWSWQKISSDINTTTISTNDKNASLPQISVFCEDREAYDLYESLMLRQPIKKYIKTYSNVFLGCKQYINLVNQKVPDFTKGIVCLDADAQSLLQKYNHKNIVILPGQLPPDQLIFEHLYNLSESDPFWDNERNFTRSYFTNCARAVISELGISGDYIDLGKIISNYADDKKIRNLFKALYKNEEFQKLIKVNSNKKYNAWAHWVRCNPGLVNKFLDDFLEAMRYTMHKGYSVSKSTSDPYLTVKHKS